MKKVLLGRILACLAAAMAFTASSFIFRTQPVKGQESQPEVLWNQAAIEQIKLEGQYDSFQTALKQAGIAAVFAQDQKLVATDAAAQDYLGYSVALDGDTALVGAPYDDVNQQDQGSAYVFVRHDGTWTQQARLFAQDGASLDLFGWAVALKGNTALIGAYNGPGAASPDEGAAYVFVRNGTSWTLQKKLTALEGQAGAQFGVAVALDGETAVIGAPEHQINATLGRTGVAYIFVRNNLVWTQQARINANDGAPDDRFGEAVAVDGDTALIGAPADDVGTNANQGSAYIFTRNGTLWGGRQKLTQKEGAANDLFGASVALSGATALVGAPMRFIDDLGIVCVFERLAAGWTETTSIGSTQRGTGAHMGVSVALDGNLAVIGASLGLFAPGPDQRTAYVFVRNGTYWGQVQQFGPEIGSTGDRLGYAVAIDGDTVLAGAHRGENTANDQGIVYAFSLRDSHRIEQQKLIAPDGAAKEYFGYAVGLDRETLVIGAYTDTIGNNAEQGSVYVFIRAGAGWTFQQKLTANDGAAEDFFGCAVGISGDTIIVGANGDDIGGNRNQGSAYVFKRSGSAWTQQQKLFAIAIDGLPEDQLGTSVAISGETVSVGAPGTDDARGSTYVFVRNGTTWKQEAKLNANDAAPGDQFGGAVALRGDTLLVGASYKDIGQNLDQGAVYIFKRTGTTWTRSGRLLASDGGLDDHFGAAIALNEDAAAIGAPLDDNGNNRNQGSAYVFNRVGTAWIAADKLYDPAGAAEDRFGVSVALSGNSVAVGAPDHTFGANERQGAVYTYTSISGYWYRLQKLTTKDAASRDHFGAAVAMSGDVLAAGADGDTVGTNRNQGSAYLFISPACAPVSIAPDRLPNGTINTPYDQQIKISNDADAERHISISKGALPPGLTLNDNSGQLKGTPTAAGIYTFTITSTFFLSGCSTSRDYTLVITPPCTTIFVNPSSVNRGGLDIEYKLPITAGGGQAPYTFSVTAGALPPGLSLSNDGVLAGRPTASGTFTFTITATSINGCQGARTYTMPVDDCFYTIGPSSTSLGSGSETGAITVATTASCSWTARSNNTWIKIDETSGKGIGTVHFRVTPNSRAERTGTISLAGQTATLKQAGWPAGTPRITRLTPNAVRMGANGVTIDVFGESFSQSHRVQWNGNTLETAYISPTQLRIFKPAAELTQEGSAIVYVVTPGTTTRSNFVFFHVLGAVAHASAASFNTNALAPDSIASAFGLNLASKVDVANSLPLPTELAGTTVTVIDGRGTSLRAPLFFVAPTQINYLMPPGLADGLASVIVSNSRGDRYENMTHLNSVAPGLFSANSSGEGPAAALALRIRADGTQVYEPVARYESQTQNFVPVPIDLSNPAEKVYLILFGTGIRHHYSLEDAFLKLGDMELPLAYAGPASGLSGVDQVNLLLPASLQGRGEQTLVLWIQNEASNAVKIRIQ